MTGTDGAVQVVHHVRQLRVTMELMHVAIKRIEMFNLAENKRRGSTSLFFADAALVLLRTSSHGCIRLRPPQARMLVDVGLDRVLSRSRDPGNTHSSAFVQEFVELH